MDIDAWLGGLGLEEYAQALADNHIDAELLRSLTAEDLKELGVASLGHRKKLLDAIAVMDGEDRDAPSPAPDTADAAMEGELRQVTVLFADLTGFTRLSHELGAEATHDLLNRYFAAVDSIVAGYGGRVDKHIGDNVMAVFGAPIAHTDDPERALHAAFDTHGAMERISAEAGRRLQVHIGVASGQVVASGTGSETHREYTVTGDSVNLAARLQDLAGPGETFVSDALKGAVGPALSAVLVEGATLKGIGDATRIWRAEGLSSGREAAEAGEIVGRRVELRQFEGMMAACRETGRGQTLYLKGEPGIGKSRLVEELRRLATAEGFGCHKGQALDFGAGRGRDAIRMLVRSLLALAPESDEAARAKAARRAIDDALIDESGAAHLNDLLDLPQPIELHALYDAMDNATRRRGKEEGLASLVRRLGATRPLLLVVEDIHWADAEVLTHLAALARAVAEAPAILVMTSRVEGSPIDEAWRAATHGSPLLTLDLGPLRREDALDLARRYSAADSGLAETCVERAEGNPMFLEQLIRGAAESYEGNIPGSIQSVVLTRMDHLAAPDRAALQAAAVIGQHFPLPGLRHLIEDPGYDCSPLVAHVLVRPDGESYQFAHALIREGAYGALLMARRQTLHRRAADWHDGHDLGLTAEHFDRADDAAAPAAYLAAARAQAAEFRHERALDMARRGIELAADAGDRYALTMLLARLEQETGAPTDAIATYRRAAELARTDSETCEALIGVAAGVRLLGGYEEGMEALNRAEPLANSDLALTQIHNARGNFFFAAGNLDACMAEHEDALHRAERAGDPEWQARALGGLGDAYYACCGMKTAFDCFERCIALSRENGLVRIELSNRYILGVTRRYMLELDGALDDVLAALEMARKVGDRRALLYSLNLEGEFRIERGELEGAEAPVREGLEVAEGLGNRRFRPYLLAQLARLSLRRGHRGVAQRLLEDAWPICQETDAKFIGPRVLALTALATEAADSRVRALANGEAIIKEGCAAHNVLWFRRDAIEASIAAGEWDEAERHAAALEEFTRPEPLPWSDYYMAWGRALAAFGRDPGDGAALARLKAEAEAYGLAAALPVIERSLDRAGVPQQTESGI